MIRLLPLFVLFLSGCATLSEDQCRTVDWRDLGLRDGRHGYTQARLAEHHEACAKYGIRPHNRLYDEGRRDGLRDYCELANALREGLAGRQYQGVCPGGTDRDFRDLNAAAYAVYGARKELENTGDRIHALEREREDKKTSDKRRKQIREEIRKLDRTYDRLKDKLRWRERDLDRARDMLRD